MTKSQNDQPDQATTTVKEELALVTWPTAHELKTLSLIAVATMAIGGVAIWVIDTITTTGLLAIG